MMRKHVYFPSILLMAVALVSGCSTVYKPETDVEKSYDFNQVENFAVIGDRDNPNIMLSDIDRNRLNMAIEQELESSGLKASDESTADILVSYFIVTKDKTKVRAHGQYPAYGYGGRYGHAYGLGYGVNNVSVKNYVEGTLVVDFIDRESMQAIWRSTLSKPIKHHKNIQEREQAVSQMIKNMLSDIPKASIQLN